MKFVLMVVFSFAIYGIQAQAKGGDVERIFNGGGGDNDDIEVIEVVGERINGNPGVSIGVGVNTGPKSTGQSGEKTTHYKKKDNKEAKQIAIEKLLKKIGKKIIPKHHYYLLKVLAPAEIHDGGCIENPDHPGQPECNAQIQEFNTNKDANKVTFGGITLRSLAQTVAPQNAKNDIQFVSATYNSDLKKYEYILLIGKSSLKPPPQKKPSKKTPAKKTKAVSGVKRGKGSVWIKVK